MSWDKYITNNFLIPLKMNETGYEPYFEKVSDVSGHILYENNMEPFSGYNLSWALSAGALYSTAMDLLKWTAIYDDSLVLSEESKEEMQSPFKNNYGLGIFKSTYFDDILIRHDGHTVGFGTNLEYLKKSKIKVITFDNIDGKTFDIAGLLLGYFKNGKTLALKLRPIEIQKDSLQEYVGSYGSEKLNFKIFLSADSLYLQPDGQRAYLLAPNDKDSFALEGFAGEEFLRNSAGKITTLRHYQGGGISLFTKKK